jgi:hypothetical protein
MRATVMYGAGDVRVEDIPDAQVREPTDALGRHACCDLWPYQGMKAGETG